MLRRNFRRILTALLLTAFLGPMANPASAGQLALIPNPTTEVKELILEAFLFPDDYRERISEYCSNLGGFTTGSPLLLTSLRTKSSNPQARTFKTEYENLIQANNQGIGPKVAAGSEASSLANAARLKNRLISEEIAGGHAFDKHVIKEGQFPGITTRSDFAKAIESFLGDSKTITRDLSKGRTAYWNETTGTVLIRNPSAGDGGTYFIPNAGRSYFEGLK